MPTPNLSLPFLEAGQAQKHVTHNEALRLLDSIVQLAVVAVSASPPMEPGGGERHIVATDGTGAFDGHDNEVAAWQDGAWNFLVPQPGWRAWNADEETLLVWNGAAWTEISSGGGGGGEGDVAGPEGGVADGDVAVFDGTTGKAIKKARGAIDYLGVGTPPDATDTDTSNRLIVKASRVLFHARTEAETPGTGDIKLQISKEAEADSASFFFSTNFSGRAEFGLVESDEFKLKVSEDGSAWLRSAADAIACFCNASGTDTVAGNTDARGHYVCSRAGSSGYTIYKNGSSVATPARTSAAPSNATYHICARNGFAGNGQRRIAAMHCGPNLTGTEISNLHAILNMYLSTVGSI